MVNYSHFVLKFHTRMHFGVGSAIISMLTLYADRKNPENEHGKTPFTK